MHDVGDVGLNVCLFLEAHGGCAQAPSQLALQLLSQGCHCSCLLSKGTCSQGKAKGCPKGFDKILLKGWTKGRHPKLKVRVRK